MIPVIAAAIGAAGSIFQAISGASQARKAKKMLEEYQRQDIVNPYKNMGVNIRGEQLQSEGVNRDIATYVDAMSKSGIFGAAAASTVADRSDESRRAISARISEKEDQLRQMIAQGDIEAQRIREQRDIANLRGIGNLQAVGQQNMFSGISNIAQSAGQFARLFPGNENVSAELLTDINKSVATSAMSIVPGVGQFASLLNY